jgi:hypothetical protein
MIDRASSDGDSVKERGLGVLAEVGATGAD